MKASLINVKNIWPIRIFAELIDIFRMAMRPMEFSDFETLKCPSAYSGYRSEWLERELEKMN